MPRHAIHRRMRGQPQLKVVGTARDDMVRDKCRMMPRLSSVVAWSYPSPLGCPNLRIGRHVPKPNLKTVRERVNGPRAEFFTFISSIVAFHASSFRRSHSTSPLRCASSNCWGSDDSSSYVKRRLDERSSQTIIFGPVQRHSVALRLRHNPVSVAGRQLVSP